MTSTRASPALHEPLAQSPGSTSALRLKESSRCAARSSSVPRTPGRPSEAFVSDGSISDAGPIAGFRNRGPQ